MKKIELLKENSENVISELLNISAEIVKKIQNINYGEQLIIFKLLNNYTAC